MTSSLITMAPTGTRRSFVDVVGVGVDAEEDASCCLLWCAEDLPWHGSGRFHLPLSLLSLETVHRTTFLHVTTSILRAALAQLCFWGVHSACNLREPSSQSLYVKRLLINSLTLRDDSISYQQYNFCRASSELSSNASMCSLYLQLEFYSSVNR